jgi:type VI secretion system protein ImpG
VRREPRLLSQRQKQQGARSSYVGEEVFVSLVDSQHAPYREDVRQLAVSAWVTNRDLPNLLPQGAAWTLESPGPVKRVDTLRGPTRPVSRRPVGDVGWSLVNHLSHRQLPMVNAPPDEAAASLRMLLGLYGAPEDVAWQRQVGGLRALTARTAVRRLPLPGPLTFGAGVEIEVEVDDMAFQGASAFLFASVLERYFARHAAINTFTSLVLRSTQRGEVMCWSPRVGMQETA